MRIIAGEFRRRLLKTPPDDTITRPIPDRVKESLFSMLSGNCVDANVFDAFAGTGAIGLEAVSRGAARCVMVEREASIARILQANIETLGVQDRCEVLQADALGAGALARAPRPLNLAFLDPPYPLVRDPLGFKRVMAQAAALMQILEPDGFLILRTPHPLVLESAAAPVAAEERPKRFRKGKGKRRWSPEDEEDGDSPRGRRHSAAPRPSDESELETDEEGDGLDEDGASEGPLAEGPEPKPEAVPADLTLAGAVGPETHVYHGMAIHLYARAKS